VLEKYRDDGVGLVKKRHEQKRVHSWDWPCIYTAMKGYRVRLDALNDELAAFLMDSLLKQWKHAQRYWEIHHSLIFFSEILAFSSKWYRPEVDIIEALAFSYLQIEKAESCNMFNCLYVLALITHLSR
jgi:hypothetical protein